MHSVKFVEYMCDHVLPSLDEVVVAGSGDDKEENHNSQLDLIKLFAELCLHCGTLAEPQRRIAIVFDKLIVGVYEFSAHSFIHQNAFL